MYDLVVIDTNDPSFVMLIPGELRKLHAWFIEGEHPTESEGTVRTVNARTIQLQGACGHF